MRTRRNKSLASKTSSTTGTDTPTTESNTTDTSEKLDVDQMIRNLFLSEGPMAPDGDESIEMQREMGGE